jgi:hypothetical protein
MKRLGKVTHYEYVMERMSPSDSDYPFYKNVFRTQWRDGRLERDANVILPELLYDTWQDIANRQNRAYALQQQTYEELQVIDGHVDDVERLLASILSSTEASVQAQLTANARSEENSLLLQQKLDYNNLLLEKIVSALGVAPPAPPDPPAPPVPQALFSIDYSRANMVDGVCVVQARPSSAALGSQFTVVSRMDTGEELAFTYVSGGRPVFVFYSGLYDKSYFGIYQTGASPYEDVFEYEITVTQTKTGNEIVIPVRVNPYVPPPIPEFYELSINTELYKYSGTWSLFLRYLIDGTYVDIVWSQSSKSSQRIPSAASSITFMFETSYVTGGLAVGGVLSLVDQTADPLAGNRKYTGHLAFSSAMGATTGYFSYL